MNDVSDRKLQQQVLLGRRVEGDYLMLADEVLQAALVGTRHLTAGERSALQASPLTLRRLRALTQQRSVAPHSVWRGSSGMLRAASSNLPLESVKTDDACWTLHFVAADDAWRVILVLDAGAPFASELVRTATAVRVCDGVGSVVLQGCLDADGECEARWSFDTAPALHFQQHGAAFAVHPVS